MSCRSWVGRRAQLEEPQRQPRLRWQPHPSIDHPGRVVRAIWRPLGQHPRRLVATQRQSIALHAKQQRVATERRRQQLHRCALPKPLGTQSARQRVASGDPDDADGASPWGALQARSFTARSDGHGSVCSLAVTPVAPSAAWHLMRFYLNNRIRQGENLRPPPPSSTVGGRPRPAVVAPVAGRGTQVALTHLHCLATRHLQFAG